MRLPLKEIKTISKQYKQISNGFLKNCMACNVIIHKMCKYGFTIFEICNDGSFIYQFQKNINVISSFKHGFPNHCQNGMKIQEFL